MHGGAVISALQACPRFIRARSTMFPAPMGDPKLVPVGQPGDLRYGREEGALPHSR
jgi:hypothetical protein